MNRPTWRQHLADRYSDYILSVIVAVVLFLVVTESVSTIQQWQLRSAAPTEWIEYHGLEFIGEDQDARAGAGALRMRSDRTIHRAADLRFIDTLLCRPTPGEPFEFVSQNPPTQGIHADPSPRRSVMWLYNADYPTGRECMITSTIVATVGGVSKRQNVSTAPFTVKS